jgi:hypothetical protein
MKYTLIITTFLALLSCRNPDGNLEKKIVNTIEVASSNVKIDTTLILKNGFSIEAGQKENYGDFNTYTYLKLSLNNIEIITLKDSLEYEFGYGFSVYPTLTELRDRKEYEIAIEVNDRPNKNYLIIMTVRNNLVAETRHVPSFITTPINLDVDEKLEAAGFWDYAQIWGTDNQLTAYNPIIFYELTENGLQLDSSLTVERNTVIYGKFEGYHFSESIEMPIDVLKKMDSEINLIGEKESAQSETK